MRRLLAASIALAAAGLIAVVGAPAAPNDGGPIGDRGGFNSLCQFSHRASDDPIVFPGQPGASHSHDFAGNDSTDANSTPESLVASLSTSCVRTGEQGFEGKPGVQRKARSGYWFPTLYEDGQPVTPSQVNANYESKLTEFAKIQPHPAGLRIVFGNAKGGSPQSPGVYPGRFLIYQWACLRGGAAVKGTATTPPVCNQPDLYLDLRAPNCWDGRNLDSLDHKSHMAYASRPSGSYFVCPPTHPVMVPQLRIRVIYPTRAAGAITLASGATNTAHADFMNGWDQPKLEQLVRDCINKNIYCGFGDKSTG